MPVESATYLNQLVATNPLHTDGLDQADSHMRLIKQVLLNTFPNVGAAVQSSATDLNAIQGMINATTGVLGVDAPSPASGNTGGGIMLEGASGQTDILLQNTGGALVISAGNAAGGTSTTWTTMANLTTAGGLTLPPTSFLNAASIKKNGYELLPIGCILMWSGSVASIPTGWSLCNGSNGTPNLTGSFVLHADGSTYVPGQTGGSGTGTVTLSTAGAHNHGGADGLAGGYTPTGVTDTQGAHSHTGQTAGHALSIAEMPSHTHVQMIQQYPNVGGPYNAPSGAGGGSAIDSDVSTEPQGGGAQHIHGISTDGAHAHNLLINAIPNHQHTISTDGSHTHTGAVTTLPPFYALCYIMKTS